MGVEVSEQREVEETATGEPARGRRSREEAPPAVSGLVAQVRESLRTGLRELQWRDVLLFGVASGALMSISFLQGSSLSIIAGIVPVGTGLLLGRRV
jgi:hypothetical protein